MTWLPVNDTRRKCFFLPGHDFVTCQEYRRSYFARAPSQSHFGSSFLRELRLALVSRLGSSKPWLRQPSFKAYRKVARMSFSHSSLSLGYANLASKLITKLLRYLSLSLFWHRKTLGHFRGPRTAGTSDMFEVLANLARFGTCAAKKQKYISSSKCKTVKVSHKRLAQSKSGWTELYVP